jgi:hypothetical protein
MSGLKFADANPREPTNCPTTEHPSSNALSSDRLIPFRTPFFRSLASEQVAPHHPADGGLNPWGRRSASRSRKAVIRPEEPTRTSRETGVRRHPIATELSGSTVASVGKFITRMRPGDAVLQDQIFAEAHRLYETKTPLSETISRLIELAGDNPNAFFGGTKKNTKGLHRTPEGQAVLRLIGIASAQRDASHRTGVPLLWGRRSPEEKSLAAMPIADVFDLLAREEPTLLDVDANARQLAVDHREDGDGGAALREALGQLVASVISTVLVGAKPKNGRSIVATQVAAMVVAEHLAASAGVDTSPSNNAAGSWWPPGE